MDWIELAHDRESVADFCKNGNTHLDFVKGGEFFN
jgi:hypothetical protein